MRFSFCMNFVFVYLVLVTQIGHAQINLTNNEDFFRTSCGANIFGNVEYASKVVNGQQIDGITFNVDFAPEKFKEFGYAEIVFLYWPQKQRNEISQDDVWKGKHAGLDTSKHAFTFYAWSVPDCEVVLKIIIGLEPECVVGEKKIILSSKQEKYTIPYNGKCSPANTRAVIFAFEKESNVGVLPVKIRLMDMKFDTKK